MASGIRGDSRRAVALSLGVISLIVWQLAGSVAPAAGSGLGWSVVRAAPKAGGGEPSIAIGPEGKVYLSYPSNNGTSFFRSRTDGRTWRKGAVADPSSGDTTVNVDSSGAVYEGNLDGNLQGDVWKSFDEGQSWPQRGTGLDRMDATGNPFFVDHFIDVAAGPDGRGHVAFTGDRKAARGIFVANQRSGQPIR